MKTAETIRFGTGIPQIFNDEVVVPAFLNRGVSLEDAQCYAGWGGLIVLPVVEGKLGYIAAVAVGAVVTAVCVNVLKSLARKNGSSTDEKEDDLDLDFEIN
jgi:pyruvate-formate lyase